MTILTMTITLFTRRIRSPRVRAAGRLGGERCPRAEAAAGGGAAGNEVGAGTRAARPGAFSSLVLARGGGEAGGRCAEAGAGGAGTWGRGPAWPKGHTELTGLWKSEFQAVRCGAVRCLGVAGRFWDTAAREVWKLPAPGAPAEEGRRGRPGPSHFSGLLSQFARTALGNLLTGKPGRETNASVLEELRVTSLGAEAFFSFPAPCPTSARLGQRRMCHQLWAAGGIPGPPGAGVPETKCCLQNDWSLERQEWKQGDQLEVHDSTSGSWPSSRIH
ncbi:uncharacterized protein LOC131382333 [Hylobates moloch]|uniref:uncharacterized protein LOC131382333 n=1 Tax=Hylobates moloch TaxID=81572 RepID=UPI002675F329|nr:uncharacterized protein LOC131382333 [Hylobates moloch]